MMTWHHCHIGSSNQMKDLMNTHTEHCYDWLLSLSPTVLTYLVVSPNKHYSTLTELGM